MKEIRHAIRDIANGSKHFALDEAPKISIGPREISSFYAYFFGPQYSIDTKSLHFLMYELVGIVMDYFEWIFDDESPGAVPVAILEKLEYAKCLDSWDHVPMRSWPLFKARHVLRTLFQSDSSLATR
ncbi:hypothetical protein MasN3_29590 [Massilia varians]|uniref:Uncharacterized protein n=2 Tax=Massilia varians TaxID=457921 RepID=A0ABN6TEB8_9BURK|nr:hypothetical protein MasN3_29590 [Massilia varians]